MIPEKWSRKNLLTFRLNFVTFPKTVHGAHRPFCDLERNEETAMETFQKLMIELVQIDV